MKIASRITSFVLEAHQAGLLWRLFLDEGLEDAADDDKIILFEEEMSTWHSAAV